MNHGTRQADTLSAADRLGWLRLIRSEIVGPIAFHQLPNQFGTAGAALDAQPNLARRGGGRRMIRVYTTAAAAAELGYPVVLKVSSPEVLHKSERGLVSGGLFDESSLRTAFEAQRENLERAKLKEMDGFLVQKMMRGGEEFLLGMVRDPQFGPLITVGLGGPATEVWGDVSVRLAPISRSEAGVMLSELRGARLLDRFRGRGPLDREALIEAMVSFGALADSLGGRLIEADLNPVFVQPKGDGVWVADALFALSGGAADQKGV